MDLARSDEIGQLAATITTLEAQRAVLGDVVVDTTVAALQERLQALQVRAVPQRKQVTVLVADLTGFTAMSETLDPEEVRDRIDRLWQHLDQIIVLWGGHVDQHTGDGVLAYFGVPTAHEDDPERAVSAALAMHDELRAMTALQPGPALALRIGLHTGQVILAPYGSQHELAALGKTLASAAQLEALAPAGEVLISGELRRQVERRFLLQPFPQAAEIIGEPAFLVRRRARPYRAGPPPGPSGVYAPMIGRDGELQRLQQWLADTVTNQRGRGITIVGEAGMGKTRLAQEFTEWLRDENAGFPRLSLYEVRVELARQQLPYVLLRALISQCCNIADSDSSAEARRKLVHSVQDTLAAHMGEEEATRSAHFIGQLIGFNFRQSPSLQPILDDARQIRQRAFTATSHFIQALCSRGPLVIVVEDAHWADEGSLDALWHLIGEITAGPLFLVMLARPTLFERRPEWRETTTGLTHRFLPLNPLREEDAHTLVRSILRNMTELPAALLATIAETAGGNPFYVEEIVRVLLEDQVIRQDDGRWELGAAPADLRIPATLTGVVQARLDRLTSDERDILQRAAVVGRVFWDKAIVATNPPVTTAVEEILQQLEAREFIVRQAASSYEGTGEFAFKHSLLREVAYESVLVRQQRAHHEAIAGWLRMQSGDRIDEAAGLIAGHYELAGKTEVAAGWYGRAAEQAQARYAPETAIGYYRKALSSTALGPATLAERVRLYGGLGETLRWQARFGEAVEALEAMRAAAEAAGDVNAQIRALQSLFLTHDYQGEHRLALESASAAEHLARQSGSPADLSMALSAKGWALLFLGEEEQALALGEEARARAEPAGTKRELAYSYMLIGGALRMRGAYERAVNATKQALALFSELGDRIWEGLMLYHLGQTERLRGDYARAVDYYARALEVARAVGDHYGAMSALSRMGRIARLQGSYRQAEQHYSAALRLAEKSGNVGRQSYLVYSLGELKLAHALEREATVQADILGEAQALLQRAIAEARQAEQGVTEAAAHIGLARMYVARGEPEAALGPALAGLELARLQLALWQGVAAEKVAGTAWWVLGQIASLLPIVVIEGEQYDADRCFAESLAIWEVIGSGVTWERARTLRDWSTVLFQRGEVDRADALRQEAADIFMQLRMPQEIDKVG